MKKIFSLFLFVLLCSTTFAQSPKLDIRQGAMGPQIPITWGVGAKIGGNLAWVSTGSQNTDLALGFVAGGFVEMNIGSRWAVSLDLLYSSAGWKYKDVSIRNESSYLIMPVLLNFYPLRNLAIKAGVQPSALMAMWQLGSDKRNVTNQYNRFDLSIPVGISYSINRVVIDARYNIGVTNILDNDKLEATYNSAFTLSVGFRFVN